MSEQAELILVISTIETAEDADRIARSLIDQSLAACVQIDGPIRSHYRWSGHVETASEYRLMIKSSRAAWPRLLDKLAKIHPYDEPEIISIPVTAAAAGYRDWVIDQTT